MDGSGGRPLGRPDVAPVDLVWPPDLLPPSRPPALLYLDLNHWIGLSKARLGRESGSRYQSLLEALRLVTEGRRVRILLSGSLVQEISAIRDPGQREHLAAVIEELTEFEYLAGLVDVRKLELQAVMDAMTGTRGLGLGPVQLIGKSLLHSFGMVGGLRVVDANGEPVALGAQDRERLAGLERIAEKMLVAGPTDDDVPGLQELGYAPEIPRDALVTNALIEQEFADRQLSETWRRGRLRDVLIAREVNLELNEMLAAELHARGLTLADVATSLPEARRLVLSMPSSCVVVEMKTSYHRDSRKRWTINDLHDIHAMSLAVPYCDIVFTDAAARDAVRRAKLHKRMNTLLPRTPEELREILQGLPGCD